MPSKAKSLHHRDKIRASQILQRLDKHAMGEVDMTQTQIRAAEIALKKVVPDLQAITHRGDEDNPVVQKVTYEWLKPSE